MKTFLLLFLASCAVASDDLVVSVGEMEISSYFPIHEVPVYLPKEKGKPGQILLPHLAICLVAFVGVVFWVGKRDESTTFMKRKGSMMENNLPLVGGWF